jgi:uncharacterized membrane protein YecN with MAPEG domain
MLLPVTLTIAAATAVIALWLAARISRIRVYDKVMMGDGDQPLLTARMRAHANFAEHAPFVLILMALVELAGGSTTALWIIGALFVAARIAHPLGMERPVPNPLRAGGAGVTWLLLAVLAGWALTLAYTGSESHAGRVIGVAIPPAA